MLQLQELTEVVLKEHANEPSLLEWRERRQTRRAHLHPRAYRALVRNETQAALRQRSRGGGEGERQQQPVHHGLTSSR